LLPLGELAACLGEANEVESGLRSVEEAIARCDGRHEQWYIPELLRIKGELMLKDAQQQSTSPAEQCFLEASALASQQGAPFWELRNALSLARLCVRQDRNAEAAQILTPVCAAFADARQVADAREAKALLATLGAG
jgi:predicted ATPase